MELDRTTFPALRERIQASDAAGVRVDLRTYPGYPRVELGRARPGWLGGLAGGLAARRSPRALATDLPARRTLSRLLAAAHGLTADHGRGPAPSAGGLQALELYLVAWGGGWLDPGAYHFDRAGHALARVAAGAAREAWVAIAPSLGQLAGGSLLWVLVGDHARVEARYGDRAGRFLLLEAGHLMQCLCLASSALGRPTVPLGGVLEPDVARALALPPTDRVLYVGCC